MLLGYNTNGFAHHELGDAVTILAELGYESVALSLEREVFDPPDRSAAQRCAERLRSILEPLGLRATVETGSRFILDPRRKHQPTMVSASPDGRGRRIEFLRAAIDIAEALSVDSVSLWSGAADDDASERTLWDRLTTGLGQVLGHAEKGKVRLSFEPEPGMFVDTMAHFADLRRRLDHPLLGLTLDVGHVHCLGDGDLRDHLRRWRELLWNVHIEDMRRGRHEHLMFGEGEIDFQRVFAALHEIDYRGPVHVELPRHSHDAVETARRSYEILTRYILRGAG